MHPHHWAALRGNPAIHACLGSALARMQAEATVRTLTQRLISPQLAVESPRYRTDVFRSLQDLPITFTGVDTTRASTT